MDFDSCVHGTVEVPQYTGSCSSLQNESVFVIVVDVVVVTEVVVVAVAVESGSLVQILHRAGHFILTFSTRVQYASNPAQPSAFVHSTVVVGSVVVVMATDGVIAVVVTDAVTVLLSIVTVVVVNFVVEVVVIEVDVVGHELHKTGHAALTLAKATQLFTVSPVHTLGSLAPLQVVAGHTGPSRRSITNSRDDSLAHPHGGATTTLATVILFSTDFSNFVELVPTFNTAIFPAVRPTALLYVSANSTDIVSRCAASNNT